MNRHPPTSVDPQISLLASVTLVERLMPGRAVALIASAWEVPPSTIKQADCLRVSCWVKLGVPRRALVSAIQRAQLDALR